MTTTGTGDIKVESHKDESVSLTVGGVTAHIRAGSWMVANEAAWALGNLIAGRLRMQSILLQTSTLASTLGELERLAGVAEQYMRRTVELVSPNESEGEGK